MISGTEHTVALRTSVVLFCLEGIVLLKPCYTSTSSEAIQFLTKAPLAIADFRVLWQALPIDVVFEDEHLMVINKVMPSPPTAGMHAYAFGSYAHSTCLIQSPTQQLVPLCFWPCSSHERLQKGTHTCSRACFGASERMSWPCHVHTAYTEAAAHAACICFIVPTVLSTCQPLRFLSSRT